MNSKNVSQVGQDARDLIHMGVEVNAEIADDEPHAMPQGLDRALLKLIGKHGVVGVLEALHDAAWSSAEMNEEEDEVACLRARIVGKRLGHVIDALK
jgi:hypothetical protein